MASSTSSASPTSTSSSGGGGNNDDEIQLIIALLALAISVVALIIAVLQALQQYFASATGYSNCGSSVIGGWSTFTHRKFRATELRFEVQFKVPVLFVAPPANKKGPLGKDEHVPIIRMNGTQESLKATFTPSQDQYDRELAARKADVRQGIHTADNEEATWLGLLMAIQRMERESGRWHQEQSTSSSDSQQKEAEMVKSPRPWGRLVGYFQPGRANSLPTLDSSASLKPLAGRSLMVCMQPKLKVWDSVPEGINRPYAITAESHLVEMMAMLGIFWKEFDRDEHSYRAQGNGFMVKGAYVEGLGVTFTFQKSGPTWFKENRLVANNDVKTLCFGFAYTIFRTKGEVLYADEPKGKGTLQLGSLAEIGETLAVFGCNTNTIDYFRRPGQVTPRYSHIFPVPFEILGMVGIVFQMKDTLFRMLPNPTVFYWSVTESSLSNMLKEYESRLESLPHLKHGCQILDIVSKAKTVSDAISDFGKVHTDDGGISKGGALAFPMEVLDRLHDAIAFCDAYLTDADFPKRKALVQLVFRAHIQEVLDQINRYPEFTDKLDSASVESQPYLLIEFYMTTVRDHVVKTVTKWLEEDTSSKWQFLDSEDKDAPKDKEAQKEFLNKESVDSIWCTLIFRMLCWLLLHDFHMKDIQVSKSEAYGSRMPVYIL